MNKARIASGRLDAKLDTTPVVYSDKPVYRLKPLNPSTTVSLARSTRRKPVERAIIEEIKSPCPNNANTIPAAVNSIMPANLFISLYKQRKNIKFQNGKLTRVSLLRKAEEKKLKIGEIATKLKRFEQKLNLRYFKTR